MTKKLTLIKVTKRFSKKGFVLLTKNYKNNKQWLKYKCYCGTRGATSVNKLNKHYCICSDFYHKNIKKNDQKLEIKNDTYNELHYQTFNEWCKNVSLTLCISYLIYKYFSNHIQN